MKRRREEHEEENILQILSGVKVEMNLPGKSDDPVRHNQDKIGPSHEGNHGVKENSQTNMIENDIKNEQSSSEEGKDDVKQEINDSDNDKKFDIKDEVSSSDNEEEEDLAKDNIKVEQQFKIRTKKVWDTTPKKKMDGISDMKSYEKSEDFFQCELCGYQTKLIYDFKKHMFVHTKRPEKCDMCDFETTNKIRMIQHKNKYHTEKPNYYCDQCQYQSKKKGSVVKHVETVHEGHRIHCDHCEKKFLQHSLLNKHMKNVHGIEPDKTLRCDMCIYTTVYRQALTDHKKREHGLGLAKCDKCEYKGKIEKDLVLHISMMHPEPPITQ